VLNSRTDWFITKKKAKDTPAAIRSIQKSKHPAQVMMFGLVSSTGLKMPPVFLKSGFCMGAREYLETSPIIYYFIYLSFRTAISKIKKIYVIFFN
jgi:hypothetical protein